MSWTPHNDGYLRTTGNITFVVVWAAGTGNGGMMSMPNPYLYRKTVTIQGPGGWTPPPPAPPPPPPAPEAGCIRRSAGPFRRSPVFVQRVRGARGAWVNQTMPAGRCVPCRFDSAHRCVAAEVQCPDRPGVPVIERTWLGSARCDGEPDSVAAVPAGEVVCPGEEHYSPEHLDLERFVAKLQRDQGAYFNDSATALRAIAEYRRMLELIQRYPNVPAVPSKLVDLVWHEHVLDTRRYHRDSLRMFGEYLHHSPSFGGGEEKAEMVQQQRDMLRKYTDLYGEAPDPSIWPTVGSGEKMPDCCSAFCVKPQCASCVGCNAVHCGYLGGAEEQPSPNAHRLLLSPSQFAGYVPTAAPGPVPDGEVTAYACSISPMKGLTVNWTIDGAGMIHFHGLLVGESWFGVGLNTVAVMVRRAPLTTPPDGALTCRRARATTWWRCTPTTTPASRTCTSTAPRRGTPAGTCCRSAAWATRPRGPRTW